MVDLRKLWHFVTLASHLSYSRAAEELGLTQPALTRSIQVFERDIGIRLFDRDRGGVRLTPQGLSLVEHAKAVLVEAEDFGLRSIRTADGRAGRIRFGMAPLAARALLAPTLEKHINAAPDLINDVVVRNVDALWPLLTQGELEFFVSAEGQVPDTPPVRAEIIGTFPITVLVRDGHPLLAEEKPSAVFPVLLSGSAGTTAALPGELSRYAGQTHVVEDYGTLVWLTQRTDAIWLSSALSVGDELQRGRLRCLKLDTNEPSRGFQIIMYSLNRRTQSPTAIKFKETFREIVRNLKEICRIPAL